MVYCDGGEQGVEDCIRQSKPLERATVDNEQVEPYIIVDCVKDKIRITINSDKKYRVLSNKNLIQCGLDVLMVDMVKALLENLGKAEEKGEQELKELMGGEKNEGKFCRDGRDSSDDPVI